MGKFNFTIPQDFMQQLGRLQDVDRVAQKMLNEAAPILRDNLKKKVEADYSKAGRKVTFVKGEGLFGPQYGEYTQTGSLLNGIRMSRSKKVKNGGFYVRVYFSGKDEKGVPNSAKAIWLEYGTKKQYARPFLTKVVNDSKPAVMDKMREVFEREMKG